MPIDKVSAYTVQELPELRSMTSVESFPPKAITGRDVVLINPFQSGGGDYALGHKLANIALEEGCRVTIFSMPASYIVPGHSSCRNISSDNKEHGLADLHNPLFIVAPVDILSVSDLGKTIEKLCGQFNFKKQDIILIEEMDLLTPDLDSLAQRERSLKKMGFNEVTTCKLGFSQGSIGYLPIDKKSIENIKNRFEVELTNLIDGYNFSLDKTSRYHLAYISCDYMHAAQIFIANTLSENRNDDVNENYIMVMRSMPDSGSSKLVKILGQLLTLKNRTNDFPKLFANAIISFSDPVTGKLQTALKVKGEGKRHIQIVFTKVLPENIFKDFMCLSHAGMGSGDQSLGEFLSLTGQLPYYDLQPWKEPLVNGLWAIAQNLGGDALKDEVSKKIVGSLSSTERSFFKFAANKDQPPASPTLQASMAALNRHVSAQTADGTVRALLRAAQAQHPAPAPPPLDQDAQAGAGAGAAGAD